MTAVYRRYAEWLVSISWKRFILLSILLMIVAGVLSGLPPFTWTLSETTVSRPTRARDVDVKIDDRGVTIRRKEDPASGKPPREITIDERGVRIDGENIRRNVEQARRDAEQARRDAEQARRDAEQARRQATEEARQAGQEAKSELEQELSQIGEEVRREVAEAIGEFGKRDRVVRVRLGDYLPQLAFLFIMLSAAIKVAHAARVKAEAKAAEAQEVADAESLKRQVVEARMAAMQAQVEPHFLFNTLASIDHLIEVDPARASRMQKNLIALLRAAMPAMRDSKATTLGRELDVVRPYLEILKVRMEERLKAEVAVPEGLQSADFPPMMLQSLVENAIKHGLEPKAEGGSLSVGAEVVHGKLAVSVADTGVGFARAATAGTGTGLNNIRERLKLIYGDAAELRITENAPAGTKVTIVVPYKVT